MSSKSLEELLSILDSTEDQVEIDPTDVELFIRDLEISASSEKVRSAYIYWAYLNWKEQGNGFDTVLTRKTFFSGFKKHFNSGRMGKYRYYNINGESLKVGLRELKMIRDDYNKERKHRRWLKEKGKKET